MELSPATAHRYVSHALHQMLAVARRVGDDKVNERPVGEGTNAVAALVIHCCAVTEFWLGHVGCGRPSQRDREGEFSKTATVTELDTMVAATLGQLEHDLAALDAGGTSDFSAGRQFLLDGDESTASLVVHVVEELFQHLGHAELAADVLLAPR